MNFSFADNFSPTSRVWIYQSSRNFSDKDVSEIDSAISLFAKQWTSHSAQLKATGKVMLNRFIILMADESLNAAGGCSIDKSVHFIKEIEKEYKVSLFDRLTLLFRHEHELIEIPVSKLNENFSNGLINKQSTFFNNSVQALAELKSNWMIPVANSWLASRIKNESIKV